MARLHKWALDASDGRPLRFIANLRNAGPGLAGGGGGGGGGGGFAADDCDAGTLSGTEELAPGRAGVAAERLGYSLGACGLLALAMNSLMRSQLWPTSQRSPQYLQGP